MAKKKQVNTPPPVPDADSKGKKGKKKDSKDSKNEQPPLAKKPTGRTVVAQSSSWTGKLPGSLLHEHCQKQKWNKVEYDMRRVKDGFIGTAILSWKNPKTQEVLEIKMIPNKSIIKPQETSLEARHYAATYALHRIASDKNMQMILPSNHKNIWADLEAERKKQVKSDPQRAKLMYSSNPFATMIELKKLEDKHKLQFDAKRANEEKIKKPTVVIGSSSSPSNSNSNSTGSNNRDRQFSSFDKKLLFQQTRFPRKVWDETIFIDLNPDLRKQIEESIKHHINWVKPLEPDQHSKSSAEYSDLLLKLGFKKVHVAESLQYTNTFQDSLDWLILHIPEDDLPPIFVKSQKDSNVQLKLVKKDIKLEYMIQRLTQGGFSIDDVTSTLKKNDWNEVKSGVALSNELVDLSPTESLEDYDDSYDQWKEEIEGLKAIYEADRFVETSNNDKIVEIVLRPSKTNLQNILSLRVYKSHSYPNDLAGLHIIVRNESEHRLANYIKVSIVTQLSNYLVNEVGALGVPYIFSCIDWLEMNLENLIENPGPLYDPTAALRKGLNSGHSSKNHGVIRRSNKTKRGRPVRSNADADALSVEYKKRHSSSRFKDSLQNRSKLPAWKMKDDLVRIINSNKVCLITGETGSGKSTQIVQFILDDLNSKGDFKTNIVCTQPRRISTIGLADRISEERVTKCGVETGYIIRGENKTHNDTRISFVTTGVLLRMIQALVGKNGSTSSADSDFFKNLGYIFIDEVHERSIDSDFLLIILKRIINKFPNLKVVLMSATIDINIFNNYFDSKISHAHIEGRTFPITDYYLEEILDDLQFKITSHDGEELQPKADSRFFKSGNINYNLISQLVEKIDRKLESENNTGSILIFLPGIMEINKCIKEISSNSKFWLLPLHSTLSSSDQKQIFNNPPPNKRKIVVSTNIAETSITIPDAVVVVDAGKVKQVHYDSKANTTKLLESWCSKAEAGQRRGRAGRIRNGYCYKLYTKEIENEVMLKYPIPEIKRTKLESVYLVVKSMGISNVFEFLKLGLDPPSLINVDNAKFALSELGALNSHDELTNLGSYLSMIPTDSRSGKLLLYGTLFGCLESCLTLASISTTGSPFMTRKAGSRDDVKRIQSEFGKGNGDLISVLNAFNEYNGDFNTSRHRKRFLDDNCLSYLTMSDIQSTRVQYLSILKELGFIPYSYSSSKSDSKEFSALNRNSNNVAILKALVTSSSYPQIARVQYPNPKFLASASGSVALDPDLKKVKLWIRNEEFIKSKLNPDLVKNERDKDTPLPATRAFLHPSSTLFNSSKNEELTENDITTDENGNYIFTPSVNSSSANNSLSSSFVSFNRSQTTSKLYLHDITPTSILSVLLFGGEIGYDLSSVATGRASPGIVMDGWLPIRTWCKNGVLVTKLRELLDDVLAERLDNVGKNTEQGEDILAAVEKLLSYELK